MDEKATIVKTPTYIHIIYGIEARSVAEIDGKIPIRMTSVRSIPGKAEMIIVENPKREVITIGPGPWAMNNEHGQKTLNLVGYKTSEEAILEVISVSVKVIEPTYM